MARHDTATWRRFAPALTLLLVPALATTCSRKNEPAAETSAAVNVTTSVARMGTLVDRLTASGTVVVSRAAEFTVYAPEAAEITEMPKREGDPVQPGDLLVRFDIATLTLALANGELAVSQAAGRLDIARSELDKLSKLAETGLVPRASVDAARNEVVDAQAALNRATGELNTTKGRQDQTEVRAKFAGIVAKRWRNQGDTVIPAESDPIVRVVDETRLQVVAPMSKADLAKLTPGQAATVAAPGAPPEPATIASLPAIIEAGASTVEVRLSFAGPTTLKRDAIVDVDLVLQEHPNVLIVQRKAIQREEDVAFVMLAGDDNVAHRRTVQVGVTTRDEVQILSGLTAGERVITSGLDQISDGAPIFIQK